MSDDYAQPNNGWMVDFHAPVTDPDVDDTIELILSVRAPVLLEDHVDCAIEIDSPRGLEVDTKAGSDRQQTLTVEPGNIHEVRWICHATATGPYMIDGRVNTPDDSLDITLTQAITVEPAAGENASEPDSVTESLGGPISDSGQKEVSEVTDESSGTTTSPSVHERVIGELAPLAKGPIRYTHLQFVPFPLGEKDEQVPLAGHLLEVATRVVVICGVFVAAGIGFRASSDLFVTHPVLGLPTGLLGTVAIAGAVLAFGVLNAVSHIISFMWPGLFPEERDAFLVGGTGVAIVVLILFPVVWVLWFVINPVVQAIVYGLQQVRPSVLDRWVGKKAKAVIRLRTDDYKLGFDAAPTLESGTHGSYTLDTSTTHHFAVELARGEQLTAGVDLNNMSISTPTVAVYDPDRWKIAESAIKWHEDEPTVSAVADESGHHYVAVSSDRGVLEYQLKIEINER